MINKCVCLLAFFLCLHIRHLSQISSLGESLLSPTYDSCFTDLKVYV